MVSASHCRFSRSGAILQDHWNYARSPQPRVAKGAGLGLAIRLTHARDTRYHYEHGTRAGRPARPPRTHDRSLLRLPRGLVL